MFLCYNSTTTLLLRRYFDFEQVQLKLLFQCLCPRNILRILRAFMNDQKLLFLSEKVDDLVQIIEGFISLLYPFDSRHLGLYMPVVPHNVAVQSDGKYFKSKRCSAKCSSDNSR